MSNKFLLQSATAFHNKVREILPSEAIITKIDRTYSSSTNDLDLRFKRCRKREKTVPRFFIKSWFIQLIYRFFTALRLTPTCSYQLIRKNTHEASRCKHVEHRHI